MIIDKAKEVLRTEARSILEVADRIDKNFESMVELICDSRGRIIISGIGKSGLIGKKIVATLNSTGSRSFFLHPVEAMHGDLGQVGKDDVFLALSNSGETEELNLLVPSIRNIGCKIIAFTGNHKSTLAGLSDMVIDVGVDQEACPLGLAPTNSTTVLLAVGDALAMVLIDKKEFKPSDFKKYHPGGALGQRLSSNVKDIMLKDHPIPVVTEHDTMDTAVEMINQHGLGATLVVGHEDLLTGIITDGDIRRLVAKKEPFSDLSAGSVMTRNPRAIVPDSPTYDALYLMEHHQITVLPVVSIDGRIQGVLHLHDILGKGQFKFNGN